MVNKVFLMGNVGNDPEMLTTKSGNKVCRMSVATSEQWTDKQGEKQERTDWHKVISWNRLAELCAQYVSKGSMVHVEGRIENRSWEDDNGQKRYATEVIAQNVRFVKTNKNATGSETGTFDPDEDLPF